MRPVHSGIKTREEEAAAAQEDTKGDTVYVHVDDGNIEKAIKTLKRLMQKEGVLKEIKRRSFYEKPSERERRKQREARKRRLKAERRKSWKA
jgi:small subunit ribosomal protein S21